jgi:hypothetical protein
MIDKLKTRYDPSNSEKIQQTLTKTSGLISQQHPQYQRYCQLSDTYNALVRTHEKNK